MARTDKQVQHIQLAGSSPSVSVVIPAYNSSIYIGEALESVFTQTFSDYEVIIVNDGSPDTEELQRVLDPYRDRIVYIKQENGGPGSARNTAILRARGEYIAFLDSDDIWMPEYLSEQVKALRSDPSIALICADARLFGDSALSGKTFFQVWPSREPVTFEKLLNIQCAVLTMCVVAHKRSLIDAGLFDTRFYHSEDYDLWLRLAHNGERFAYQHRVLAYHRLHGASLAADESSLHKAQIEVYQKLLNTLTISPQARGLIEEQIARCNATLALQRGKQQIMAGRYDEAAEALRRANDYYRSRKLRFALLSLRFAPRLLRRLYHVHHRFMTRGVTAAM